ncbi:MAG: hypothetical protein WHX52_21860 [Anaerolineae bacterium]
MSALLAQRREVDLQLVYAAVEVLPEFTQAYHRPDFAVGGADDAHVDMVNLVAAQPLE